MITNIPFFKIIKKMNDKAEHIGYCITFGDGTTLETNPIFFSTYIEACSYLETFLREQILITKKNLTLHKLNNKADNPIIRNKNDAHLIKKDSSLK